VTGSESAREAGTFAEESQRLLAAFQEWAARGRGAAKDLAGGLDAATGGMGHSPECAICPVCQAIRLLRGARPEVVDHLSDAAASFLSALAALVPAEADHERRTMERVQHIDVRGDDSADSDGEGAAG
jgi:hypothetical protein